MDNINVCSIVNKGSRKPDLQDLAMQIFNFTSIYAIHLKLEWLPRSFNGRADYLSKIIEKDDWGISFEILSMIMNRWGQLDVDYFASEHNAKLPVFYSKFWCYKSSGVDAFTFDWGRSFGLCATYYSYQQGFDENGNVQSQRYFSCTRVEISQFLAFNLLSLWSDDSIRIRLDIFTK